MSPLRSVPAAGAFRRRFTEYAGLHYDEFSFDSAWLRETAWIRLPPLDGCDTLVINGAWRRHPDARGCENGLPGLTVWAEGAAPARVDPDESGPVASGPQLPSPPVAEVAAGSTLPEAVPSRSWTARVMLPADAREQDTFIRFRLTGAGWTNFLAWMGRITGLGPLQRFRRQNRNRQLRIRTLTTPAGEIIYDFAQRDGPFSRAFARRHARLGMNIVGFLTADLGLGESARCMVRAADAARLPTALVALKLNCRNPLGDLTYVSRLQEPNPHGVNVIHVDPPAARDIDHHHGAAFRRGRYNVAYFAWELPEFPDAWLGSLDYFDEVWCPSEFVRRALAPKSPLPVLTLPHAIGFPRPSEPRSALRERFGLPADAFLFLSLFDLNSYAARKNPRGAIDAFRAAQLDPRRAGLVVKVHNADANPEDLAELERAARDTPGIVLLTRTLSRADTYALEAACDGLVSLHRSEGFGLVVAEAMYLGKPVIATDWSATSEYLTAENGCPVRCRLVALERSYGPYSRGALWAEPDVAHAAEQMRRLAADPAAAERLGAAARVTIEERFALAEIGAAYRRRLEAIATF